MGTLNFYGYFTDFRNIWCGKFSVFGGGTCISVWKGTSWKAQQHGSLNHSTDKKMDTIYVQYTKKKHKETMIFICYIGIYHIQALTDVIVQIAPLCCLLCSDSTLETSLPAFCHARLSARFRSLLLPATIHLLHAVSLQEGAEVTTKGEKTACVIRNFTGHRSTLRLWDELQLPPGSDS